MRAALAALLLAGCAAQTPPDLSARSYRDTSVPISSSTRFDAARFAGDWTRIAAYGFPFTGDGCATARFTPQPGGRMAVQACADLPDGAGGRRLYGIGPHGRLEAEGAEPIWILWVAEDFGTAVLGTPSGAFGWVLNRGTQIRPDRYAAATELLDFNGYDTARLKRR